MKKIKFITIFVASLILTLHAKSAPSSNSAINDSVTGQWQTIDDKTQKPRSIVEIYENDGIFYGKIVKIYPNEGNKPNCEKCPDEFKDKPILGLQFMWGLKKKSEKSMKFDGGHILDPESGSIYKSKIELTDAGTKLEVRGYIGISLFGRSQQWIRINPAD